MLSAPLQNNRRGLMCKKKKCYISFSKNHKIIQQYTAIEVMINQYEQNTDLKKQSILLRDLRPTLGWRERSLSPLGYLDTELQDLCLLSQSQALQVCYIYGLASFDFVFEQEKQ